MIFDTHTHVNDQAFSEERDRLLRDFPAQGICSITEIGFDLPSSRQAVALSHVGDAAYPEIYAAVGLHPDAAETVSGEVVDELRSLSRDPRVVAIGEIGLDYHYTDAASPESQKRCFREMLRLGREVALPVVIHSREAARDTYELILEEKGYENGGVIHCFSYSPEVAQQYVKLGMYIGIGGVVTFQNAKKLKQVAEVIPLSSIVLETDCPYMAPVPVRGTRNDSRNLRYVVQELSRIKGVSEEEIREITTENAKQLYHLR